jgi:beta-phosphoglucomutase
VEDAAAGVASIKDAGMFAVGVGDPQVLARRPTVFRAMALQAGRLRLIAY